MMANILIVDDELVNRRALSEAFSQLDHLVDAADSGEAAIARLRQKTYDVAVLDLKMPGVGGLEVLKTAESIAPDTKFVILTAHASTESAIFALRSRAFDYLIKPCNLNKIIDVVHQAIDNRHKNRRRQEAVSLLEQALNELRPEKDTEQKPASDQNENFLETTGIEIDMRQQSVSINQQVLNLTPIEYKLVLAFIHQPTTILSYTQLAQLSHNLTTDEVEARQLLRTHLFRLSQKLSIDDKSPLQCVRGRGYIFNTKTTIDYVESCPL
jgi:DNA-binding response OmpR family regulator